MGQALVNSLPSVSTLSDGTYRCVGVCVGGWGRSGLVDAFINPYINLHRK